MIDKKALKKDLKTISLEEICSKYNLSFKELVDIANKDLYTYMEEGDKYKFITKKKKGGFVVQKYLDGSNNYFGTYYSFDDALIVRDELIKEDWNEEKLKEIYFKFGIEPKTLE